jgi:2-oxoisovalerate dehydrogenase E1 component alpha subunit
MFEDVYETVTDEQEEQISKLKDILERYPGEYDIESHDGGRDGLNKQS